MNSLAKKLALALACVAIIVGMPACGGRCNKSCKTTCTTKQVARDKEVMMDDESMGYNESPEEMAEEMEPAETPEEYMSDDME